MSGLENLQTRLQFKGGNAQLDRMKCSKVKTLKRALLYSYQSATAVLNDGREFRCLINKDKTKIYSDDKIISIPFDDICLNEKELTGVPIGKYKTSEGTQIIGMKPGDVFTWKETNTDWIVYLQRLEETAYFRAEIRRCRYEIDINGKKYKVYTRGPIEQTIDYYKVGSGVFNRMNYTLMLTITKDEYTDDFFHRFTKIKFLGKNYEVQAIDGISTEGIIDIYLKEYFSNSILDEIQEEEKDTPIIDPLPEGSPEILGDSEVYPYDVKEFTIKNLTDGQWAVNSNKVIILNKSESKVTIKITTGRSGKFILSYNDINGKELASKEIKINSL